MTFTLLDTIFIAIILLLAIHGFISGFIKEFFSKVAVVGGVLSAIIFYNQLTPYLIEYIKNEFVTKILAFLLIFIFAYLIVRFIQLFLGKLFSGEILKGLDRSLGFFFGAVEGLLVVCVILILFYAQPWFNIDSVFEGSVFHSSLYDFLAEPVDVVQGFIALK